MFSSLFINILLLVASTFIAEHIAIELPEKFMSSTYKKLMLGIGGGILGIIMMIYTININDTKTILDLRILIIMIISTVGGFVPAIITSIIITLFRVGYFGISQSSVFAIIQIVLCLAGFCIIENKINNQIKSWIGKLTIAVLILTATYGYLLKDIRNAYIIIIYFDITFVLIGLIEYYLLKYSIHSNELYKMYKKNSTQDFLTGLNNTRNFDKLLNDTFMQAVQNHNKVSCLMIDIDHFKQVNDTYGHAVGDIVLKELAEVLKSNCRSFDLIGRVGGEEFCSLLLDCPADRSVEIGERIRSAVKAHKFYVEKNKYINITISIGAATYPDTVKEIRELKEKADNALYKAKRTGRDRVCINNIEDSIEV